MTYHNDIPWSWCRWQVYWPSNQTRRQAFGGLTRIKAYGFVWGRDKAFQEAIKCHICNKELAEDTVRDHCQVTGKFRGAANSNCNLNFRLREKIRVFFHNLKGYDAHHIMNALGKFKHKKINCIPQNHEKYISFSLGRLDFVDTFQFLSTSLDKLSANLAKEGFHNFPHF